MNAHQFQSQILCLSDKSYRMALSILKDENSAKDALQELMMRLWEKREQLDVIANHQAFVLTSMRNLCLDIIRKTIPMQEIPANAEYNAPTPYQQTERTDMMNHIGRMIDSLPEMQRTILRMKDVEEMDLEEIARIMSMTENAVTVNLSRARKKLREMIVNNHQKENVSVKRPNLFELCHSEKTTNEIYERHR
ncbi:RNA polymerase sigma factor [Proteiniphilum sp. UBA5384]|uniref:RNA polymerase sigma factor n=1 Tax=Proteiniphilum sp. UBA5384 TaxID=1947279 RepID=UPI0025F52BF6|nr:sigma-70 family RNA polymerase sigma factor [Proteiniphilum sp. UBA5384]